MEHVIACYYTQTLSLHIWRDYTLECVKAQYFTAFTIGVGFYSTRVLHYLAATHVHETGHAGIFFIRTICQLTPPNTRNVIAHVCIHIYATYAAYFSTSIEMYGTHTQKYINEELYKAQKNIILILLHQNNLLFP